MYMLMFISKGRLKVNVAKYYLQQNLVEFLNQHTRKGAIFEIIDKNHASIGLTTRLQPHKVYYVERNKFKSTFYKQQSLKLRGNLSSESRGVARGARGLHPSPPQLEPRSKF